MATGSGKTKVMSLAVAWQFFNAVREQTKLPKTTPKHFCSRSERNRVGTAENRLRRRAHLSHRPGDPEELEIFWDFDCVMRGEAEKAPAEGTLFLTNIQQFYERPTERRARAGGDDGRAWVEAADAETRIDRLW